MAITSDMAKDLRGSEVYDAHDEKIGKVGEVYVDNSSGEPKWVTVSTGMLGTKETFVPLEGARAGRGSVTVATDKKTVKGAPDTGRDSGQLSEDEEHRLYSHYGLTHPGADDRQAAHGGDRNRREQHGRGDDGGMTRSEERLEVGKESVETGTVRLRKYVVTENEKVEVPVRREEVRLEREPITEGRRSHGELGDAEQSVTLHAERPVVSKEAHEVERVRLDTRTVTENQMVADQVRKEQIEVEDPSEMMAAGRGKNSDKAGEKAADKAADKGRDKGQRNR